MIAAERARRCDAAVLEQRTNADADAAGACQRLDAPDQHARTEDAVILLEARREVGDLHRAAALIGQDCRKDGGVPLIALRGRGDVLHHHIGEALVPPLGVVLEQAAEHRVTIQARQAIPDDAAELIDQRRHMAVADDAEIQAAHAAASRNPANCPSQARTAAGEANAGARDARYSPATGNAMPPMPSAWAKPSSSVRSSPT